MTPPANVRMLEWRRDHRSRTAQILYIPDMGAYEVSPAKDSPRWIVKRLTIDFRFAELITVWCKSAREARHKAVEHAIAYHQIELEQQPRTTTQVAWITR